METRKDDFEDFRKKAFQHYSEGSKLIRSPHPDYEKISAEFRLAVGFVNQNIPVESWTKDDYIQIMKSWTYLITSLFLVKKPDAEDEAMKIINYLKYFVNKATTPEHDHPACRVAAAETLLCYLRERAYSEKQGVVSVDGLSRNDDFACTTLGLLQRVEGYLHRSDKQYTDFDRSWQRRLASCYRDLVHSFGEQHDYHHALEAAISATKLYGLHGGREDDFNALKIIYRSLSKTFKFMPERHAFFAAVSNFFAGRESNFVSFIEKAYPFTCGVDKDSSMGLLYTQTMNIMRAAVKYPALRDSTLKQELQDSYLSGRFYELIIPVTVQRMMKNERFEIMYDLISKKREENNEPRWGASSERDPFWDAAMRDNQEKSSSPNLLLQHSFLAKSMPSLPDLLDLLPALESTKELEASTASTPAP